MTFSYDCPKCSQAPVPVASLRVYRQTDRQDSYLSVRTKSKTEKLKRKKLKTEIMPFFLSSQRTKAGKSPEAGTGITRPQHLICLLPAEKAPTPPPLYPAASQTGPGSK
jgi:hypothetical protein